MKRKPIAFALALAMLTTQLCGCGSKGISDEPTDSNTPDTTLSDTIEPVAEKPQNSTLFIYMCGSNLETKQGLAGKNIDELLAANVGEEFNVVIQTGGAKTWRSHDISNSNAQRYIVKNGELQLIDRFLLAFTAVSSAYLFIAKSSVYRIFVVRKVFG